MIVVRYKNIDKNKKEEHLFSVAYDILKHSYGERIYFNTGRYDRYYSMKDNKIYQRVFKKLWIPIKLLGYNVVNVYFEDNSQKPNATIFYKKIRQL